MSNYNKSDVTLLLKLYEEHRRPNQKSVHNHERQNQMIRGWMFIAWAESKTLEEFMRAIKSSEARARELDKNFSAISGAPRLVKQATVKRNINKLVANGLNKVWG